jgi:ATP-dependent DNA helicase UvrD/PcrA
VFSLFLRKEAAVKAAGQKEFVPTPEQREAIEHVHGPMLVVAGAGTGKTTVLARRVVRLIEEVIADPSEILAVSYTRNSANDLLKRIALLWKGSDDDAAVKTVEASGLKAGTFHAYCYRLLVQAGQRFELIDDKDLYVLLRRRVDDLKLEYYIRAASPGEFLYGLNQFFKRCHDELRTPDDYDGYVAELESGRIPLPRVSQSKKAATMSGEEILGRCHEIARVFRHVEEMLAAENLGTYNHVITRAIELLRDPKNADQLERARRAAKWLLIDEFQDSNVAQIELTRLLAGEPANVFAVGDPDQAIYRFRGATTGTFDQFLKTFGVDNVKRVTMTDNRRSTEPVLKAAYSVISVNPEFTGVELPGGERLKREPLRHKRTSEEPQPVLPVLLRGWESTENEATFIAQEIERLHRVENRPWKDFAVLYRKHDHRNELVQELTRRGVPFTVTGLDLMEIPEVRDLMAELSAMAGDDSVSLLRVAALARFGLEGEPLRAALMSLEEPRSLESVLEQVKGGMQVVTALVEARSELKRQQDKAKAACEIAMRQFGIKRSRDTEAFAEFVSSWSRKPQQVCGEGTLAEFLEYLQYFREGGGRITAPEAGEGDESTTEAQLSMGRKASERETADAVRLLTVHAAKGLEFPVVFVLRLTQPSFPARYREELVEFPEELREPDFRLNVPPKMLHEEEERRLFYVGVTRAEDLLYLCAKKGRGKDPTPPGALRELTSAGKREIPGCVEFELLRDGGAPIVIHAAAEPRSRIAEWVDLTPSPLTTHHKLSASAIESYEVCPLRYKMSLEWNLPAEPTANLHFGSAMHAALYAHFDAVRKRRPMTADAVVQFFLGEFGKKPIADVTQRRLYEKEGPEQLRAFLDSAAAKPHGQVAMLEHWFSCEVAGSQVIGRIDRVDEDEDGYVIVDYKTGNPKSQNTADDSAQLSVYALAMSAKKPVRMLILQNLEDNSSVVTTRSGDELRAIEAKIADVAAGIAAAKFAAKPGRHCNWCAYQTICPAKEVNLPPRAEDAPTR